MKLKDEQKERQILNAALQIIEQKGLAGLSISDVAKEAKIATGTIYIYFSSKEALLNHLYIVTKKHFATAVFGGCVAGDPVRACFYKTCAAYLDYLSEYYAATLFMHQFVNSPFLSEPSKNITQQYTAPLQRLLEQGKKELLLKNMDTELMITFLHGAISECSGLLKKQRASARKSYYDQIASLCWDALKA